MTVMMYLPIDQWSPRFDSTFFSVKIEGATKKNDNLPPLKEGIGGKTNLPAVYYEVSVFCEHRKITFLRRYSNFKWLYDQIEASPPKPPESVDGEAFDEGPPVSMPPGTCFFQVQDDAFIQNRKEQLRELVDDLLKRPGYSEHPAAVLFFELDSLGDATPS